MSEKTRIETGLKDAAGVMICIGDLIKKPVECNREYHGDWSLFRVKEQGRVPILCYVKSEKGQMLPRGYLANFLSDEYNQKLLLFSCDVGKVRPLNDIKVVPDVEA